MSFIARICLSAIAVAAFAVPLQAADRGKIEAFMQITGFDVALQGMRLNAKSAPEILGLSADDFGLAWTMIADDVFAPGPLMEDALDILERTLDEDSLNHAAGFYASDLGQRLVAAENESHLADDDLKSEQGEALAADLLAANSPQPDLFLQMSDAIGSVEHSIASYREVQVRFILAAQGAGLFENNLSEDELRAILASNDEEVKKAIRESTVSSSAYTYRDFSDADMRAYLAALSTPEMQRVYELMNAIQYSLMADRFERLAARLAELQPSQDL